MLSFSLFHKNNLYIFVLKHFSSLSSSNIHLLRHFLCQHWHIWGKGRLIQHHPNKTQLSSKFNSTQGLVFVFKRNNSKNRLEGKITDNATSEVPSGEKFRGQRTTSWQKCIALLNMNVESEGGTTRRVSQCSQLDPSSWWDVVSPVVAVKLSTAPEGKQSSLGKEKVGRWLCIHYEVRVNGILFSVCEHICFYYIYCQLF